MSPGQPACLSRVVELAMGVGALGLEAAAGAEGVEDELESLRRIGDRDRESQEIEAWAAGRCAKKRA
jgi:hypothetical protein